MHHYGQSECRDVEMPQRYDFIHGLVTHSFYCGVSWIGGDWLASFGCSSQELVCITLKWQKSLLGYTYVQYSLKVSGHLYEFGLRATAIDLLSDEVTLLVGWPSIGVSRLAVAFSKFFGPTVSIMSLGGIYRQCCQFSNFLPRFTKNSGLFSDVFFKKVPSDSITFLEKPSTTFHGRELPVLPHKCEVGLFPSTGTPLFASHSIDCISHFSQIDYFH